MTSGDSYLEISLVTLSTFTLFLLLFNILSIFMPRNQQIMVHGPNPGSCLFLYSPRAEGDVHIPHWLPFKRLCTRLRNGLISPLGEQRVK